MPYLHTNSPKNCMKVPCLRLFRPTHLLETLEWNLQLENSLQIEYCGGFESSTRFLPLDKSGIIWFLRGLPYLMK